MRCIQPATYLRERGFNVTTSRLYRSIPAKNSIVIIHRALLDRFTATFINYAKSRGSVVVYDTDDLLFEVSAEKYLSAIKKASFASDVDLYKRAMQQADVVLVATKFLGDKARLFHPDVRLMRNGLDAEMERSASQQVSNHKNVSNFVTIAYLSGSESHDRDFCLVENTLIELLRERKDVKVLLAGHLQFSSEFESFGDRFEYVEFLPYEAFQCLFSRIDINLVPLEVEEEFCQAKSELKVIEAAVYGIPSVVSPTGVHKEVIEHNVNGKLVEDNDWRTAIEDLLDNEERRRQMGTQARLMVLEHYSANTRVKEWQELIDNLWAKYAGRENAARDSFDKLRMRASLEKTRWIRMARVLFKDFLASR